VTAADAGGEELDLEAALAALQLNSSDVRVLLRVLVSQLADLLGPRLSVERAGGWLRKSDDIKAIQVALADDVLRAEVQGSSVTCTIAHSSGGIRIRSQQVGMDEWLRTLLGGLRAEAVHSDRARQALENIVIGGSS